MADGDFTNHGTLGQALMLYTQGMREFVRERLIKRYPSTWLQDGVLAHLPEDQKRFLKQDVGKKGGSAADLLEPSHFARIVPKEFDRAFSGVWPGFEFKAIQLHLQKVANARNEWAHPRSGDMLQDDVAEALRAMVKILQPTGRPEAEKVNDLWKRLTGVEDAATPGPAPETKTVAPAPSGALPYWWQVTEPWDGFQNPTKIDESLFAASLGAVAAGAAREEYQDPEKFFQHTYFTVDLKRTIADVVSRMQGGDGASVTEMQTPFGGGKTHALITLYHLVKDPQKSLAVPGVREALGDLSVPSGARIAVFDGTEYAAEATIKEDGTSVSTLWGEIAYQLDPKLYRQHVQASDDSGTAPGNAAFREVLSGAAPCLILIDELVSYLVKLKFSSTRRNQNVYRQTVNFLHELLRLAGNVPGATVLLTLPKSQTEFGGLDPQTLQQELGIADDLRSQVDAVVSKRTPVADTEVYTLLSKRLFKPANPDVVNRVVDAYYGSIYDPLRDEGVLDPNVFTTDYRRQMVEAYPFHPELIDVLYKKWGASGDFPRTRTVLQLLANVVAEQWTAKRGAHAIQSSHVNLERERTRTKVLSAIGASVANDAVVAADIIGGDAHADGFDERRGGEYAQHHIARGVATTILLHSSGAQLRAGAMPSDIRLGTISPLLGRQYADEVIAELEETLWYVHRDGELLRFQAKQNLYRRIAETAQNQSPHAVDERIKEAMAKAYGESHGFRVLQWSGADGTIPDQPEPSIAVLAPISKYRLSDDGSGQPPTAERAVVHDLWNKVGGGLRNWRNALVLVAPDRELWDRAEQATREVMAYDAVLGGKAAQELSEQEKKDLTARRHDKTNSLKTSLVTAYKWVFYPNEAGELSVVALPPAVSSDTIATRVVGRLESADYGARKVLRAIGAAYFDAKLAPHLWKNLDDELDLSEMSRRFPQWTQLPILPDREGVLRQCIREGIEKDLWSAVYGDKSTSTYRQLIENKPDFDALVNPFDGATFLVRGAMRDILREQLGKKPEISSRPGPEPAPEPGSPPVAPPEPPPIGPTHRYSRVRMRVTNLPITKSMQLQPYLWKFIQDVDATSTLGLTIDVECPAGLGEDVLRDKIQQSFEMLGLSVDWEPT